MSRRARGAVANDTNIHVDDHDEGVATFEFGVDAWRAFSGHAFTVAYALSCRCRESTERHELAQSSW